MDEIQYIGEHLLPGQIGRMTIILSFVASLLATIAYYFAEQRKDTAEASDWIKMGRIGYIVHGLSIFTAIACIFYVMYFRMYEYQYAQLHVSDDLEMKYILSAFWEGQEGSFLLWMFWHVILGFILIRVAKNWEAPVMTMLSLVQFFIGSMVLGV
jgi:cytochrome c-type biogenesis protein CcmF